MNPPFRMIVETEMEKYRFESFWEKEPETVVWIESFENGDVFFDVGANIGIYSLYCAAIHPKCKIYAFEPDGKNFNHLLKNIEMNGFKISAYGKAISDRNEICPFYESSTVTGASGGQINLKLADSPAKYDIQTATIDTLGAVLDFPNHIKIDIDGQETKVVRGMMNALFDPRLKSVLIEVERGPSKDEIITPFLKSGFATENLFNQMENHSRVRRAKEGINVENIVFTRR